MLKNSDPPVPLAKVISKSIVCMGHDGWAIVYILLMVLSSETNQNDLKTNNNEN